jgi:hypothetical protein
MFWLRRSINLAGEAEARITGKLMLLEGMNIANHYLVGGYF